MLFEPPDSDEPRHGYAKGYVQTPIGRSNAQGRVHQDGKGRPWQTPSEEQAKVARAYIAQLTQAHSFPAAIVTKIEPGRTFYPAEDYHQDFLALNPTYPYIVFNDLPKIENLKRLFPDVYRTEPVLVRAGHS